ncbi:MAG: RNA-binding protein [Patescibacteria group bacterium]
MDQKKLFVGGLPWAITSEMLRDLFAEYGEIVDAVVITDRMSGRSKGFGFVTFATEESAQRALEKNGQAVEGRNIVVNVAKPREERPRRDFGGRNNYDRSNRRDDYRRDY